MEALENNELLISIVKYADFMQKYADVLQNRYSQKSRKFHKKKNFCRSLYSFVPSAPFTNLKTWENHKERVHREQMG